VLTQDGFAHEKRETLLVSGFLFLVLTHDGFALEKRETRNKKLETKMTVKRFEDLEIWNNARKMSIRINQISSIDLFKRDYSLKDQINRSAGSVMDNIAEGFERDSVKEFVYFCTIAKGSLGETRSQLYRAFDKGYISQEQLNYEQDECIHLAAQIAKFIQYLKGIEHKGLRYK
jgi:four helix bundle protein